MAEAPPSKDAGGRRLDDRPQIAGEEVAQQRFHPVPVEGPDEGLAVAAQVGRHPRRDLRRCLLYTSDAADE